MVNLLTLLLTTAKLEVKRWKVIAQSKTLFRL